VSLSLVSGPQGSQKAQQQQQQQQQQGLWTAAAKQPRISPVSWTQGAAAASGTGAGARYVSRAWLEPPTQAGARQHPLAALLSPPTSTAHCWPTQPATLRPLAGPPLARCTQGRRQGSLTVPEAAAARGCLGRPNSMTSACPSQQAKLQLQGG
jgi:hypothetical protein